jgi:uncharacterized protein YggE
MDTILRFLKTQTTMAMAAMMVIAVLAAAGSAMLGQPNAGILTAYGQQTNGTTIKVNGEASTSVAPDEATITIGVQTQPAELVSALEQQQQKMDQISDAVMNATGDNGTSIAVGQQSINPFYSGSGVVPSNNITFNIYASIGIRTDVDELPGLIDSLAEAGFGFEGVYFDPSYQGSLLSGVSEAPASTAPVSLSGNGSTGNGSIAPSPAPPMDNGTLQEDQLSDPITISVSLVTKPDILEDAIAEYDDRYQELLDIVEEAGLSQDQVQISYLNIQPVFYGSSQSEGFNTYTQVVVRTDPENIEAITGAVQELGDAYIENVFLSLSDSAIDSARQELNRQAMDAAEDRANEIASQLELEVTGVNSIDVSSSLPSGQYPGEIRTYRGVNLTPYYYYQGTSGQVSVSMIVEFQLG